MLKARVASHPGDVGSLDLSGVIRAYARRKHISIAEAQRQVVDFGISCEVDPTMPEPTWCRPGVPGQLP
jgi:hypothetical protein